MRVGQAKRLLKNLIIADSALEIVEDTPETFLTIDVLMYYTSY